MFVSRLELTVEAGAGNLLPPGVDPQMRMSFSSDGGLTFNNEVQRSMGVLGKFNQRLIWRNQGRSDKSRVIRFRSSDPVKSNILKLTANVEFEDAE